MRWGAALGVLLWAGAAAADEGGLFGRRVDSVAIEGAPGSPRRLAQLPVRPGQPLSRQQLQQSVRLLYRNGTYSRVQAWLSDAGDDGVAVRFQVEPQQRIVRIAFNGAQALDEASLVKTADLPPGTEFSPDRVTRAAEEVARAYFRAGFRDASVRWDAMKAGEELAVDFSVSEGEPTTLVRLEFTGERGLTLPELLAAFDVRPGDRLSLDQLDAGLLELRGRYRRRGFYRARLSPPQVEAADGRAVVQLPLDAGPRLRLQVRGAKTFDERLLLGRLRYGGEEPLEPAVQRDLADRMRTFYELAGFPEARVAVRESPRPPGSGADPVREVPAPDLFDDPGLEPPPPGGDSAAAERLVTFLVREGEPRRVVRREFPGLTAFTAQEFGRRIDVVLEDAAPAELVEGRTRALLAASWAAGGPGDDPPSPRRVVPREVFATGPYRAACTQLQDLYKSEGYLDARVGPARLVPGPGGTATAVVPVEEGPRTRVTQVRVTGVAQMAASEVDRLLAVKPGDPLNFAAVEEMRGAVAALYQNAGYTFAQVEDEEEIDDQAARALVTLKVTEGPLVRVSRIELKGVGRTDPQLVREALAVHEGDPLTPQARQDSVRNLLRLGIFTSAAVEPVDPETVESDKPLVVEVREKATFNAEVRGGASYADGPRAAGLVTWGNLRGRNWTATLAAKLNWPIFRFCLIEEPDRCTSTALPDVPLERRLNAGLVIPQLQGAGQTPFDVRIDLVNENLLRPAYHLSKVAGLVSLDGLWRRRYFDRLETGLILQAEVERDEFQRRHFQPLFQTLADRKALLLPEGTIFLASLRPALTLDARDDKLNPTSGVLVGLQLDLAKALSAQDLEGKPFEIQMARTLLSLSGYVPLSRARRVVLALSARAGRVFKQDGSLVIGTKRFFLGGTQSLRGFNEDGVYPQDVRDRLHAALDRCRTLATGLGCDDTARRLASGVVDPSPGGEVSLLGRAELRFGLTETLDGGLFLDAGNLWSDATKVSLGQLRYTAGFGVRYLLPIGPAAFDCGVNLTRDDAFAEPPFRIHLSVGLF